MDKQMSMSFFTDELAEVKTHKKELLEKMDQLIPWGESCLETRRWHAFSGANANLIISGDANSTAYTFARSRGFRFLIP